MLNKVWDPKTARILCTALIFALGLAFLHLARETLVLFLFAILFAYFVAPLVSGLEKPLRGRVQAIAVVYLVLIALLGVFTGAIVINLARGRTDIDCGCFGPALRQRLSWWLLVRNGALFALLAIALIPASARPMSFLDLATAGMAAATVVVLYTAANYLIANAPGLRALGALNA